MIGAALASAWLALAFQGDAAPASKWVQAQDVICVPGEEACVVALEDGRLVRVDLETGEVEASRQGPVLSTRRLHRTESNRLQVHAGWWGARLTQRAWDDLRGLSVIDLDGDQFLFTSSPENGWWTYGIGSPRSGLSGPTMLGRLGHEPTVLGEGRGGARSPSGDRLALADAACVLVYDTVSWELVQTIELVNAEHAACLEEEYELESGDTVVETWDLAFHGEDRLLAGWYASSDDAEFAGFDVFHLGGSDVGTGPRLQAQVRVPVFFASGIQLRSDADLGRVTTSLGQSGFVHVFRDDDWTPIWSADYGGGNPSGMRLRRGGHPRWLGVSGMMPGNARLVDLVTGAEVVPREALAGCFQLSPSDSGRSLVAIRDGGRAVIDVESQALRFERREGVGRTCELVLGPAHE